MGDASLRRELVKAFLKSLLCLLLIPAIGWGFTAYVEHERDSEFMARLSSRDGPKDPQAIAFYRAHPPSSLCEKPFDVPPDLLARACQPFSPAWQFHLARAVSFWSLVAGVALLAVIVALGALAFVDRRMQHASFTAGSRLLAFASAAAVLVQGTLGVWLSFWLTGYFFHKYFLQLILIVALAVGGAAWVVVRRIFQTLPHENEVEGELIGPHDAPRLWERVRQLAGRLKTEPPRQIVGGIDNNFFVTEAPLRVGEQSLTGRTLFVSIPLLRVLDTEQADAVLAHELAHLRGGDAQSSALLGPQLQRYDQYLFAMAQGGFTWVVFPVMRFYRIVFEMALARDSREREFKADRTAAKLVSQAAIAHSLIKVSAYSRYRAEVEHTLFGREEKLDETLGIGAAVASGLRAFASSEGFVAAMRTADVPHPFDTHPPMVQRFENVKYRIAESDYQVVVNTPPATSWADDILVAAELEARLWKRYEERFAGNHEENLAYRYEPGSEAERALVLKYFPPVRVEMGKGQVVTVSIEGIESAKEARLVRWDEIHDLSFENTAFVGDYLQITLAGGGRFSKKRLKVKLPGFKKHKAELQPALLRFFHRHGVMRAYQAQQNAAGA